MAKTPHDLASALGLPLDRNPTEVLLEYSLNTVHTWVDEAGRAPSLRELLALVSERLQVRFEVIRSEADFRAIVRRYRDLGDRKLAAVVLAEPWETTDAVLFPLDAASGGGPRYVAVVDARGPKGPRAYFTMWHEVAHVLTLPEGEQPTVRRTGVWKVDPLERAMDRIASELAFFDPVFRPAYEKLIQPRRTLSFALVGELNDAACPDASLQATCIRSVGIAPFPALFLTAQLGLKESERTGQDTLPFEEDFGPVERLRASTVVHSPSAKETGLIIPRNFQVPDTSVLYRVHESEESASIRSADEDLSWWSSRGRPLGSLPVTVEARKAGPAVYGLVHPR